LPNRRQRLLITRPDHARQRSRGKRGGAAVHLPVEVAAVLSPDQVEEVVAIDLALQRLAAVDERKSQALEMRFFGGLSVEETAEALGVAPNTVTRDWNFARAWLRRRGWNRPAGGRQQEQCGVSEGREVFARDPGCRRIVARGQPGGEAPTIL